MSATLLATPLDPGSPAWREALTASKIPAMLRLNPPGWGNRFSLWHEMAGLVPADESTDEMRRGHYLEPAISAWFADRHPDWKIVRTGTWRNNQRPWQYSNPDRLIHRTGGRRRILELKSDASGYEFGTPGTDEIPVFYRAQGLWQMDTLDADVVHFAVINSRLAFDEYVIERTPDVQEEIEWLREEALAFLDTLPAGKNPTPPNIDEDTVTYETLRKLAPGFDGTDETPIDLDLADRYFDAIDAEDAAKSERQYAANLVLAAMGEARRAIALDPLAAEPTSIHVATRVPGRGDNPPYLKKGTRKTTPITDIRSAA
ncbi:YqaJ viral recombinase family protein [Rhodococcus sp. DMU2021]|uniref:YqaJ viral recombinase family protein n=1 Tax=Rhodococcus sp. DMU2021 TaxID=2866997 RepID=UPI001C7CF13C|nr:YqaJ viral recombinase family protein [Rhodococcus sp. DMU2021]MBX4168076.1 YqaJ viral recombinase family protein [Rhodococcus sp. DMU2021]